MMTRIGVMKHLRMLEEALVATKRRGREKLHFLNPVPIRLVHDRWGEQVRGAPAATLTGLKETLEEEQMEKVFEIYIKTTPERLWEAITDPDLRAQYSSVRPAGRVGLHARVAVRGRASVDAGHVRRRGEPEVDPPRRLVRAPIASGATT